MAQSGRVQKLLVTGASGFLGAHVVQRAFASQNWPIVDAWVCGRSMPFQLTPAPYVLESRHDLEDLDNIELSLGVHKPTVIIHAAAVSRIADCQRDPERARRVNVSATAVITRWCAAQRVRLVHVSTDLVFGEDRAPRGGFDESSPTGPISIYGRMKLDAEQAVLRSQAGASIVRLPLLIGPSHGRGLGATDRLLTAVDRGERPALFEDEFRTPLDVRSAAEALVELACIPHSGVLHVAGPERLSRYEIGLRALRRDGLRDDEARAKLVGSTRDALGLEQERPADVSLDATRARSILRTILIGIDGGSR